MSDRSPRRSSSASRQTSLSSPRPTRTGAATGPTVVRYSAETEAPLAAPPSGTDRSTRSYWLLSRQKQVVMRLATGMDFQLQLGVLLCEAAEERSQLWLVLPGDEGQDVPRLVEQSVDDRARDCVEARSPCDRLPVRRNGGSGPPHLEALHSSRRR